MYYNIDSVKTLSLVRHLVWWTDRKKKKKSSGRVLTGLDELRPESPSRTGPETGGSAKIWKAGDQSKGRTRTTLSFLTRTGAHWPTLKEARAPHLTPRVQTGRLWTRVFPALRAPQQLIPMANLPAGPVRVELSVWKDVP